MKAPRPPGKSRIKVWQSGDETLVALPCSSKARHRARWVAAASILVLLIIWATSYFVLVVPELDREMGAAVLGMWIVLGVAALIFIPTTAYVVMTSPAAEVRIYPNEVEVLCRGRSGRISASTIDRLEGSDYGIRIGCGEEQVSFGDELSSDEIKWLLGLIASAFGREARYLTGPGRTRS